jgi:hypothetical protein
MDGIHREKVRQPRMFNRLTGPEQLIVWSFRRWLTGWARQDANEWSLVQNVFSREFGVADGKAALAQLARLVNTLYLNACRTLQYHQPCCPCLGADEAILLEVVAACQHCDGRAAYAAAASLVGEAGCGDLMDSATALAQSMRTHGMSLPRRQAGSGETALTYPPGSIAWH